MSPLILMITAGAGIALLLFLVLKYKFQPFVALMLVSILVALVAGVKPAELVATIEGGMGKTLGHIAIIIALGAMIGRIIELSGGAEALAKTLIERFGNRRTPLALTMAGFIIGVPVFFEVGVIILMPRPMAWPAVRASRCWCSPCRCAPRSSPCTPSCRRTLERWPRPASWARTWAGC